MTTEQYKTLQENNQFILGYFLTGPYLAEKIYKYNCGYGEIHYMLLMDTMVRGLGIGKEMINRYETYNEDSYPLLIPQEVIESSAGYWKKYFEDEHSICDVEDLDEFIKEYHINGNNLEWKYLYQEFKDHPVTCDPD